MSIELTEAAADKIRAILAREGAGMRLRIFVSGGGCSGFQYGFTIEDQARPDDEIVVSRGVELLVDPMSMNLLRGSEVDYQVSVQGESFVIRNPNAAATCGCGKSFTPAEDGSGGCANAC